MAGTKYIVNQVENINYESKSELKVKDKELVGPFSINNLYNSSVDFIDLHFYTLDRVLLKSQVNYVGASQSSLSAGAGKSGASNLDINPANDAAANGYRNGDILLSYNFFSDLFSDSTVPKKFFLEETSGDSTEVRLLTLEMSNEDLDLRVQQIRAKLENNAYFSDLKLDFGKNNIYSIINIDVQEYKNNVSLVLKLYEPLPNTWEKKSLCRVLETIADTVSFTVNTEIIPDEIKIPSLKGPNFDVELSKENNNPTEFFNYDELFSFPVTSSYYSLYSMFNENSAQISIDHSNYSDFIHFSSAEERLRNFKYKLELIESYENSIATIESTGYAKIGISGSREYYNGLLKGIVENFDHYDRFLYYESGSHAWPKSNNKRPHTNQHSNSAESVEWFAKQIELADVYDNLNDDVLTNTLPLYVRDDESNEPVIMFTHMIGQHFDNLWIYFKAVSDKYDADNRLDFGISKDLVRDAIESFGYNLYNSNRSLQNLFSAFVGESYDSGSTGEVINSYRQITSGSGLEYLQPMPEDNYQKEVYKRIYHNLPYLTKAKGTHRGLRALINCFGIPENLLTIKQKGGEQVGTGQFFSIQQEVTSSLDKLRLENTGSIVTGSTLSLYTSIARKENKFTDDLHEIEVGFDIAQPTNDVIKLKYSGSYNYDDYIGDPRESTSDKYYLLDKFCEETFDRDFSPYNFWQWVVLRWEDTDKDVRGNIVKDRWKWNDELANYREPTDYIRLIKFFDNVIFRLVKEFIPARSSATTGVIVRSHILHRSKAKQVQVSYRDELITGSINLLNVTGSSGDTFGKANKSPYTTNYDSTIVSPIGEIPRNMTSEEPRMTGEFSGSTIAVTKRGELNRSNLFKSQQQPTILFNVRAFNQANIIPLACDISLEVTALGEYLIFTPAIQNEAGGTISLYSYETQKTGELGQAVELLYPFEGVVPEEKSIELFANVEWGKFDGWYSSADDSSTELSSDPHLIISPEEIYAPGKPHAYYAWFSKTPPNSEGKVLTVQICNADGDKDDNFIIRINGVEIGYVVLGLNELVGGMFIASSDTALHTDEDNNGVACPIANMEITHFAPIHLAKGQNKIEMINVEPNGSDNFGTLEIAYYDIDPEGSNLLINREPVASLTYDQGPGKDKALYFNLD